MKLWMMRHGYAGQTNPDPKAERGRPLVPVGRQQVKAIALEMQRQKELPAVIYSSAFQRAVDTADIIGATLSTSVMILDGLGPNMTLTWLIRRLTRDDRFKRVMLVGHHDNFEPAIEDLGGGKASDLFVTAEVRRFRLDRDTTTLEERWRLLPSDVGQPNLLGYTAYQ